MTGRDRIKAGDGFIYVAEVLGTNAIKIGFSLHPERRVKRRDGFRLMGFFPASLLAEKRFHRKFLKHRSFARGHEDYPRDWLMPEASA